MDGASPRGQNPYGQSESARWDYGWPSGLTVWPSRCDRRAMCNFYNATTNRQAIIDFT
jgi:hypothetical protein